MGQIICGANPCHGFSQKRISGIAPLDATKDMVFTPELVRSILPAAVPLTGENVVVP